VDQLIVTDSRKARPDIVFSKRLLAIFIDGCFWHGCPEHGHIPATNQSYWKPKIEGNQLRDRLQQDALTGEGWTVLRIWEHVDPQVAATAIAQTYDQAAG
jgi:DNA mismatch endonuclease (patch repair protein)